jgi:hypothetical protein
MHMNTEAQQPEDLASLYRRAFAEYGARALWNKRELEAPTPADALVVARALRVEGNREARRLAEQNRAGLPCRYLRYKQTFSACSPRTATRKAISPGPRP